MAFKFTITFLISCFYKDIIMNFILEKCSMYLVLQFLFVKFKYGYLYNDFSCIVVIRKDMIRRNSNFQWFLYTQL